MVANLTPLVFSITMASIEHCHSSSFQGSVLFVALWLRGLTMRSPSSSHSSTQSQCPIVIPSLSSLAHRR
ncbi:hypothetical protein, partial [Okeania sp. SIO2G5]|uniref:hypothetical protein n=1 Tax=Okeania sp. SIO2G5 TaxID=2607796 RepID=UPI00257DFED7